MIQISKLCKEYKRNIFNNLELEINSPSINLIIGESGSGKSTLLNIIYGVDKNYTGNINILDNKLKYGQNISLLNQQNSLIKRFTGLENILLAQSIRDTDLINYYAEKLQVKELLNKKISTLSAGEKQRIALIKAIINNPSILLLDEPTSHLDDNTTTLIIDLLQELQQQNMIIIITTHDYRLIEYFNNVYHIKQQQLQIIKQEKTSQEVKDKKHTKNNNFFKYIKFNLKSQKLLYTFFLFIIITSTIFFIGSISNFLAINNDYNDKVNDLFSSTQYYYIDETSVNESDDVYYYGDYIIEDYYIQDQNLLEENKTTSNVPVAISVNSYNDTGDMIITDGVAPSNVNEIVVSEDVEALYQKNYNDTLINKEVTIIENPSKHDTHHGEQHEFIPTTIKITGTYKTYSYAYPTENDYEYNGVTITTTVYGEIKDPMTVAYKYSIHQTNTSCQECISKDNYYMYSDFIYLFNNIIKQTIFAFIIFIILFLLMSLFILIPRKKEFIYLKSIGINKSKMIIALIIEIFILYSIAFTSAILIYKTVLEEMLYTINSFNISFMYVILATCLIVPVIFVITFNKKY